MEKNYDVIIDTDIGGDIDDTWAILTLLALPNINIRLISVTNGNVPYKVALLAKLLTEAGRTEIPIAVGKSYGYDERPFAEYAEGFDPDTYSGKIYSDYRSAYSEVLEKVQGDLNLLCMAPYTSLVSVLDLLKTRHNLYVFAMAGSIDVGYFGAADPSPECNVVTDVEAARKMLSSDLPITLLPLDVCGTLTIDGEEYQRLLSSEGPYARLCIRHYTLWQEHYRGGAKKFDHTVSSSILYDMICVWRLLFPEYFKTETLSLTVADDGTLRRGGNLRVDCAMEIVREEEMKTFSVDALCGVADLDCEVRYPYCLSFATPRPDADLAVYECGWEECRPFHHYGPIKRHYYIFHFVESGEGYLKCNGKNYKITRNQGFLLKAGELVEYGANQHMPWKYYWVGFNGCEAKALIDKCGFTEGENVISLRCPELIMKCMKQIVERHGKSDSAECAMLGYLYVMFSYVMDDRKSGRIEDVESNPVKAAVKYINNNYMRDIKIDELAVEIGFDRSHFYKIFREQMNESPKEYLTGIRLNKALLLMRDCSYTLERVAGLVGYEDYTNFARAFKKHYGISPKEYRENPFDNMDKITQKQEEKS